MKRDIFGFGLLQEILSLVRGDVASPPLDLNVQHGQRLDAQVRIARSPAVLHGALDADPKHLGQCLGGLKLAPLALGSAVHQSRPSNLPPTKSGTWLSRLMTFRAALLNALDTKNRRMNLSG